MNQISLNGDVQGVAQEEMVCPLVINFFPVLVFETMFIPDEKC